MNRVEVVQKLVDGLGEQREQISDGYHTFKELYEHRIALYIRLINETIDKYNWHKSNIHYDGSVFDGWFIVMGYINGKQISYHLPDEKRDSVKCLSKEIADKWDGHTSEDVIHILLNEI